MDRVFVHVLSLIYFHVEISAGGEPGAGFVAEENVHVRLFSDGFIEGKFSMQLSASSFYLAGDPGDTGIVVI